MHYFENLYSLKISMCMPMNIKMIKEFRNKYHADICICASHADSIPLSVDSPPRTAGTNIIQTPT